MHPLFAQVGQNNNNDDPFKDVPPEVLWGIIIGSCVVLLVFLIVLIFFLLTLSKTLSRCRPSNRTMEPGMVWLNLIPLFNLGWQFVTVNRVAESLDREFYQRGWESGGDYGRGLGTTTCILYIVSNIPYIGGCFALGWLVCFILYWVKIANFSGQLASRADEYDEHDDRRDDRDDRRDDDRRDDDPDSPERERKPWDRR